MSDKSKSVSILLKSVRNPFPILCQKYTTRWGDPPWNLLPNTTSALSSNIGLINNVIKHCRYVNDERGRYLFNSSTMYQYFDIVEEEGDNITLDLKTSMKSVWIGPVQFCLKSGDYSNWCKCSLCNESASYVIVFSDSDEEADIIF